MRYRNLLCVANGLTAPGKAELAAGYICKASGAGLILLHIEKKRLSNEFILTDSKEWKDIREIWIEEARARREGLLRGIRDMGVANVRLEVRDGDPAREIYDIADRERIDLIVMRKKRYIPSGNIFTNTLEEKVALYAPCPILWV